MKGRTFHARGFTLLEVMIAAGLGTIVLAVGLTVGMQMQRRAIFEEQTMMAQVTGRAVKDLIATDLGRAGLGMGNTPITFSATDRRFALSAWTEPDLSATNAVPGFAADPLFALPPSSPSPAPYATFKSDLLQLYWGDSRSMLVMANCGGGRAVIREGASDTFCTAPDPSTGLNPPSGQTTLAVLVNPNEQLSCQIQISGVNSSSAKVNANPGSNDANDLCSSTPGGRDNSIWGKPGWMTLAFTGAAYRVNWYGGAPALEYLPPGTTTWQVVSRDVERMKIRLAVIDLSSPSTAYRWFPSDAGALPVRPPIDQCTTTHPGCTIEADPAGAAALPAYLVNADDQLRYRLRQRVREVEVTLTVRTRRQDKDAVSPVAAAVDEEQFPKDGYKRRTFSFRVTPRNYAASGLMAPVGP